NKDQKNHLPGVRCLGNMRRQVCALQGGAQLGAASLRTRSIRRSGMSHISATTTYTPKEIHCRQKARGMAMAYNTGDSFPFQSPPTALLTIESGPCDAMISCCNRKYATPAIKSTAP